MTGEFHILPGPQRQGVPPPAGKTLPGMQIPDILLFPPLRLADRQLK
jgi:hypothetical protein